MVEESTMRDINDIPNGWVTSPLKSISIYKNGKAHESFIDQSGEYIVVNSKFISTEGDIVKYSKVALSPANADSILMVMSDVPNGKAIAKCFHVPKGKYQFTVNQRVCEIISKIDSKFLYYILNRNPYFLSFDDGAKQTNLRREEVENCPIKFPLNKEEQIAISTTLTDIDTLITSLQKLIEKKKNIYKEISKNLLFQKVRLQGFQSDWTKQELKTIGEFRNGKPLEPKLTEDGKYLVITLDSITIEGKLKRDHKRTNYFDNSLQKGDIVIILSDIAHGNFLGLSDIINKDNLFVLNQRVGRLRLYDGYNPKFISLLINQHQYKFKSRGQGTSQRHIYQRDIDQLEIFIPSYPEQVAIANTISEFEEEISTLESQMQKLKALKQGAMQQLLTGKIRLI